MDFSQLLNTSTEFDQNKLAILEQVVNILYTTTNNEDVRKYLNLFLFLFYSVKLLTNYLINFRN